MERSSLFLMANLGSEVSRLLSFEEKGDVVEVEKSYQRSKRILEQIEDCPQMKSRHMEVAILGEVIEDLVTSKKKYSVYSEDLQNYFIPFATRLLM